MVSLMVKKGEDIRVGLHSKFYGMYTFPWTFIAVWLSVVNAALTAMKISY